MADIATIVAHRFPGLVVQKNLCDAIHAWLINHDAVSGDDVPTILALASLLGPPDYPTALPSSAIALPRFPDSNPAPDGWTVDRGEDLFATTPGAVP